MITIQQEIELTMANLQRLHDSLRGGQCSQLTWHLRGAMGRLENCLDYVRGDDISNQPYALEVSEGE